MQLDFCPHCFGNMCNNFCMLCGFDIASYHSSHDVLQPGTVIAGRYVIGHVLGKGGFGITYTCKDAETNQRRAIKEYMPRDIARRNAYGMIYVPDSRDEETYDKGLHSFLDEINNLINLQNTPGIVRAYDFVEDNNTGYLIMEFIEGVTLKKKLDNFGGTMTNAVALDYILKVADSLRPVHAAGLFHRDISPENIMITENGSVKLIDFGSAKFIIGRYNRDMTPVLKLGFAPPEQYLTDGNMGEWTDIYALAATYYKLITGNTPPDAMRRQENDTVGRLDSQYPDVPPVVGMAVYKAMSLDYRYRYRKIEYFADALREGLGRQNVNSDSADEGEVVTAEPRVGFLQRVWTAISGSEPRTSQSSSPSGRSGKKKRMTRTEYERSLKEKNPLSRKPYVKITSGGLVGESCSITSDADIIIGRDSQVCDISVYGNSISRRHCIVNYDSAKGKFIITDISSYGTFFADGTPLKKELRYAAEPGSIFKLVSDEYIMEIGVR